MFLGLGAAGRQVVWFKIEQSVMHCSVGTIFDIVTLSFFTFGVYIFLCIAHFHFSFLFQVYFTFPNKSYLPHLSLSLCILQLFTSPDCVLSYSPDGGIHKWSMILNSFIHFSFLQTASQSDSFGPFDPGLVDCNSQQVNESVHIHSSVCPEKEQVYKSSM